MPVLRHGANQHREGCPPLRDRLCKGLSDAPLSLCVEKALDVSWLFTPIGITAAHSAYHIQAQYQKNEYVPQGNSLVSGTIRDNLYWGNPQATEEELREALHAAVADFVYSLPEGLDTHCGEQGTGLSEGQAQRIAIARGLLRPGGILLLDEPTSSVDKETEKLMLERLSAKMQDKTLILVTHREGIAQLCASTLHLKRV